ncbi:ATP-binding protein [Streptomyces hydrogenans]
MSLPAPLSRAARRGESVASCDLPRSDGTPGAFRAWVAARLDERQAALLGDELAVVASELATNAVRHGLAPIRAALIVMDDPEGGLRARLEVDDSGSGFTPGANVNDLDGYPSLDCHGRGLLIVAELSRCWGVERREGHHVVWAELAAM